MACHHAMLKRIPLGILLASSLTLVACGSGGDSKKPSNNSSRSSVSVSSVTSQIPASSASSVSQPSSAAGPSSESASQSLSQSSVSSSGEASSLSSVEASSVSTSEASSSQVSSAPVVIIPDVTLPGPIAFAPKSGAADCDVITSDAAVVTLINVPVAVTVLGGTYSINAGAYTASPGTVNAGDTLSVQVPCAAVGGQTATATLNVGDLVASFSGTTDIDAIADAIEFTPVIDAPLNSEQVSNAVTISGINTAIAISITGGEYAIDGADFTTAPGTVNVGQQVSVRAIAPSTVGSVAAPTTTTAALTVGDATYNFTVTAIIDSTAPTAEFMFPPPASMTEAPDIFTRIKFKDDLSEIARVFYTLNGGEPVEVDLTQTETINHADGSLEVRATLPLTEAQDNQLRVFAEDALGNRAEVENYAGIMVRQDSMLNSFPSDDTALEVAKWPVHVLTESSNKLYFLETDIFKSGQDVAPNNLMSIDLASGVRTLELPLHGLEGLIADSRFSEREIFFKSNSNYYKIDLDKTELKYELIGKSDPHNSAVEFVDNDGSILSVRQPPNVPFCELYRSDIDFKNINLISGLNGSLSGVLCNPKSIFDLSDVDEYVVVNQRPAGIYTVDKLTMETKLRLSLLPSVVVRNTYHSMYNATYFPMHKKIYMTFQTDDENARTIHKRLLSIDTDTWDLDIVWESIFPSGQLSFDDIGYTGRSADEEFVIVTGAWRGSVVFAFDVVSGTRVHLSRIVSQ